MKQSDIEALVRLFTQSEWDQLHLQIDGEEILLSNDSRAELGITPEAREIAAKQDATSATKGSAASPSTTIQPRQAGWVAIKAPMLGTFYTAPTPDAPPYVTAGTVVAPETEICLIEVMKLFTTVRAGIEGTVREIAVEDGEMVEYDQPLFWIEPV